MKSFLIFGMLCILSDNEFGRDCMNFWDDVNYHATFEECEVAGIKKAKEINDLFTKDGLIIKEFQIYCIPVDTPTKT